MERNCGVVGVLLDAHPELGRDALRASIEKSPAGPALHRIVSGNALSVALIFQCDDIGDIRRKWERYNDLLSREQALEERSRATRDLADGIRGMLAAGRADELMSDIDPGDADVNRLKEKRRQLTEVARRSREIADGIDG